MPGSANVDIPIRAGDIAVVIGAIVETSESGGTTVINSGSGFSGDETVYFVLVDSEGTTVIDAEAATVVDNATATVSFSLDTADYDGAGSVLSPGRFTYYWIIDNVAGTGAQRRTDDQTLNVGPSADTLRA